MRIDRSRKSLLESIQEMHGKPEGAYLRELYGILNVLDSKTASLLQFNALVVAILALAISPASISWGEGVCIAGGVLVLGATIICLLIVQIEWPFIHPDRTLEQECQSLAEVVDTRTKRYENARKLSLGGVILLVLGVIVGYAIG